MKTFYRISYRGLCFAIICQDGKVIEPAPVAGWTRGKSVLFVLQYWRNRGAEVLTLIV